jgi:hypothetical protein
MMAEASIRQRHLTEYERAVCYYTLPRVVSPVTYGIIVAYAVCVFEAFGALTIGLATHNRVWLHAGIGAVVGIVLLGVAIFMVRAVLNDVRARNALAPAHDTPDVSDADPDVPDPFEHHLLLGRSAKDPGVLRLCENADLMPRFRVERLPFRRGWKISAPDGADVCRVNALRGLGSFSFDTRLPAKMAVYVGEAETARIEQRFSFTAPMTVIRTFTPEERFYFVRPEGIFVGDCLVGRIYALHGVCYLDIDKFFFHPAVLAYFATRG